MKIAFFLNNEQLEGLDWSDVLAGNPGAGGTEYLIVLEACLMSREHDYDVILYAVKESIFPNTLNIKYVSCLRDAIIDANASLMDFLLYKEVQKDYQYSYLKDIPQHTGLIVWCHNFLSKKALDVYAENTMIKSIICVSREMLDLYMDEKAYKKMDYIYNGCTFPNFHQLSSQLVDVKCRSNIVTYVGSIVPSKSFHWLAKAWPNVLKQIPDAELYVIGSGNLYDKNAKLGKYGIASEEYERRFMPYLTLNNGKIIPSVHFMGKMGVEKNEIFKKTKVGVPNPSGETETFGITAVEMQSFGCHVVTMRCPGYLDTVVNKDNLYSCPSDLSSYIIDGLKNPIGDFKYTYSSMKERFDYVIIHKEWLHLFHNLMQGKCKVHDLDKNIPNIGYKHKWLRIIWSTLNKFFGYRLITESEIKSTKLYKKYNWHKKKLMYSLVK